MTAQWQHNAYIMLWIFSSHLCILTRAHIAWVYSYGLSLATGFTFAMTLVRSSLLITLANAVSSAFEFLPAHYD